MRTAMAWSDAARRLSLRLAPGSQMLPPAKRNVRGTGAPGVNIDVRVIGDKSARRVVFEGRPVDLRF